MSKGGYKIIDFKDKPLVTGGSPLKIEGIYDTVEDSYLKPLLLSGLNIDGTERNEGYTTPAISGSNYVFTAYGKTITITNADEVSVVNA